MTEFNRNVRFRRGLRGPGWCTPEYFGAKGSYSVDDSVAFQAANNAMATEGGGKVYLAGRQYRTDSQINLDPTVSWEGVADATFWSNNHATRIHHQWASGSSRVRPTVMENIIFGGLVANSGDVIDHQHAVNLLYRNCAFNVASYEDNLRGQILNMRGLNSKITFENCYMRAVGDADLMFQSAANSMLQVQDCTLVMPATFTHNLIENDDGVIRAYHNYVDVTAHGGSADIFQILAGGYHEFKNNSFHGAFSSGACFRTVSGGESISETGSIFDVVNPYNLAGTLALGSELTLSSPIASSVSTSVLTCATGYRGQSFYINSGAPSITLPGILFIGQEFALTVANTHAGDTWTGIGITGGDGVLATSTPPGTCRTYRWKAVDVKATGTPRWMLMGDPSSAITLS